MGSCFLLPHQGTGLSSMSEEAGKGFTLFHPSTYEESLEKTVFGTPEDLISINWLGIMLGTILAIAGVTFLFNLVPVLNSLIPTFGTPFGGSSYGGWEEGYGANQLGFDDRYDGYAPSGGYRPEYRKFDGDVTSRDLLELVGLNQAEASSISSTTRDSAGLVAALATPAEDSLAR